jgi:RNA polymerase sigma factor (sigma-70 family)
LQALQIWKLKGIPDNPSAWLYRVAKNKAIDVIRRNKHSVNYDFSDSERVLLQSEYTLATVMDGLWKEDLIKDDLLRMMFACCHPGISEENQITIILKTLCGFSTAEIAKAFLTSEDTVSKRLYRAKEFFRQEKIKLEIPSLDQLKTRTDAVLNSIYLLFNEGYNSTASDQLIRTELIEEAIMLCGLLTENEHTRQPETYALMALMSFHASRSSSRLTPEGEIILLPFQDRSKWNATLIAKGNHYLNLAAFGTRISSYHLEAAIAYEHCSAESFEKTNWHNILRYYEWLCNIAPSPVSELNKVIALMQIEGPEAALAALEKVDDQKKLEGFYLFHSLLGEIYARLSQPEPARRSLEKALFLTRSEAERNILKSKIAGL